MNSIPIVHHQSPKTTTPLTLTSSSSSSSSPTISNHSFIFNSHLFQRLQPIDYLNHSLQIPNHHQQLRIDGRQLVQSRSVLKDLGSIQSAHGSSLISIGKTSIGCGIKFEISEIQDHLISHHHQALIVPNIDLGPMCCSKYKIGPPNDESQLIASRLRDLLTFSGLVPLETLVIEPGKLAWTIYVDLVCISHDGNLFDAAVMAASEALKNARKPLVRYDDALNQVVLQDPANPTLMPLDLRTSIYSTSFAIFEDSTILPDPTLFEEEHASGFITVVLDDQRSIKHLWMAGSIAEEVQPGKSTLEVCIEYAQQRVKSHSTG